MQKIVHDFRTSSFMLQKEHGISQVTIYQILVGITKKPQMKTVKKLEEALRIRIDCSDPADLKYIHAEDTPILRRAESVPVVLKQTVEERCIEDIIKMLRDSELSTDQLEAIRDAVTAVLKLSSTK